MEEGYYFLMPFWAIVYCFLILIGGIYALREKKNKTIIFIIGEALSVSLSISIFIFYFDVITKPDSVWIVALMLIYILAFESIGFREQFSNIFNKEETQLIKDLVYIKGENTIIFMTFFMTVGIVILALPFIYVSISLLRSYWQ